MRLVSVCKIEQDLQTARREEREEQLHSEVDMEWGTPDELDVGDVDQEHAKRIMEVVVAGSHNLNV
ncbi:hypothetical protein SBDP1_1070026 [Syntrophobacter sp. SbD1]|nr:hypothetical protein SBDP1_1070026 [Syntrophobacter sp. SbD1]